MDDELQPPASPLQPPELNPYVGEGLRRRDVDVFNRQAGFTTETVDRRSFFDKSVESAGLNFAGGLRATEGLARRAAGDIAGSDVALLESQRLQEQARATGPDIQTLEDARAAGGGVENYAKAAANMVIGLAPDMAASLTGAGVGIAVARRTAANAGKALARRKAAEVLERRGALGQLADGAADQAAKATSRGAYVGAAAGSLPGLTGQSREALQETDQAGAIKIGAANVLAAAIGGAPEAMIVGRLAGQAGQQALQQTARQYAARIAKATGTQALAEGSAESMQQAVQLAGHKWAGQNIDLVGDEAMDAYIMNFFGGALLGGMLGGGIETGRVGTEVAGRAVSAAGEKVGQLTGRARKEALRAYDKFRANLRANLEKARAYAPDQGGEGRPMPGAPMGEPTGGVDLSGAARRAKDMASGVGSVAGDLYRQAKEGVSEAAQRFRKYREDVSQQDDLDEEVDARIGEFSARITPEQVAMLQDRSERRDRVGELGIAIKDDAERVASRVIPADHPLWDEYDPRGIRALIQSTGKLLRGDNLSTTDQTRLDVLRTTFPERMAALEALPDSVRERFGIVAKFDADEAAEAPDTAMSQAFAEAEARRAEAEAVYAGDDTDVETTVDDAVVPTGTDTAVRGGPDADLTDTERYLSASEGARALTQRIEALPEGSEARTALETERDEQRTRVAAAKKEIVARLLGEPKTGARFTQPRNAIVFDPTRGFNYRRWVDEQVKAKPGRLLVKNMTVPVQASISDVTLDENGNPVGTPREVEAPFALSLDSVAVKIQGKNPGMPLMDALMQGLNDARLAGIEFDLDTLTPGDLGKTQQGQPIGVLTKEMVAQIKQNFRTRRVKEGPSPQPRRKKLRSPKQTLEALAKQRANAAGFNNVKAQARAENTTVKSLMARAKAELKRMQRRAGASVGDEFGSGQNYNAGESPDDLIQRDSLVTTKSAPPGSEVASTRTTKKTEKDAEDLQGFVPTQDVALEAKASRRFADIISRASPEAVDPRGAKRKDRVSVNPQTAAAIADKKPRSQIEREFKAGVEIGEALIAEGDYSDKVKAQLLASLRDPNTGMALRYFERARSGAYDRGGLRNTPTDLAEPASFDPDNPFPDVRFYNDDITNGPRDVDIDPRDVYEARFAEAASAISDADLDAIKAIVKDAIEPRRMSEQNARVLASAAFDVHRALGVDPTLFVHAFFSIRKGTKDPAGKRVALPGERSAVGINWPRLRELRSELGDATWQDKLARVYAHEVAHAADTMAFFDSGASFSDAPYLQPGGTAWIEAEAAAAADPLMRAWFDERIIKGKPREMFAQLAALKARYPEKLNEHFPASAPRLEDDFDSIRALQSKRREQRDAEQAAEADRRRNSRGSAAASRVEGGAGGTPGPSAEAAGNRPAGRPVTAAQQQTTAAAGVAAAAGAPPGSPPPPGAGGTGAQPGAPRDTLAAMVRFVRDVLKPEERALIERVLRRPENAQRLRAAYAGDRKMLKLLDSGDVGMESRIALAYLAWRNGRMRANPQMGDAFSSWDGMFAEVLGVASENMQASLLFEDIASGLVANRRASLQGYDVRDRFPRKFIQQAMNAFADVRDKITLQADRVFKANQERLEQSGVPALATLLSKLYKTTGTVSSERGMTSEITHETATRVRKTLRALDNLDEAQQRAALRVLRSQGTVQAPPALAPAVDALRREMDEMYDYLRAAGVKFDKVDNYWPVQMDVRNDAAKAQLRALLLDPKFEAAIRDKVNDTKSPITQLVDDLVAGAAGGEDVLTPTTAAAPGFKGMNHRLFDFIYELGTPQDVQRLIDLQVADPYESLSRYIEPAIRRAAYARRFGDDGARLQKLLDRAKAQGATQAQLDLARDMVAAQVGSYGHDGSPTLRVLSPSLATRLRGRGSQEVIQGLQTYQNIRVLPLATVASLVDPIGIAVRTGGDLRTAWEGMKIGIRSLFDGRTADELREALEMLGATDELSTLAAGYGGGETPLSRKVNDTLFKYNGLAGWTRVTRYMAMMAGHRFLLKHAERAAQGDATSLRYLDELGLKATDIEPMFSTLGQPRSATLRAEKIVKLNSGDAKRDQRVLRALTQFVDEAILRPNATQRPLWHSDPYMGLVSQYKGFAYAIWSQIGGRMGREWRSGNPMVLLPALLYAPFVVMAEFLREMIQHGPDGNPQRKDWGPDDYLLMGVERSNVFFSPTMRALHEAKQDVEHKRMAGTSFLGPTIGQAMQVQDALSGSRDFGKTFEEALPLSAMWKRWNDDGLWDNTPIGFAQEQLEKQ